MLAHSVLRAVAACAPGKRITVFVPSGVMYALPVVQEPPPPPPPPDAIEVLSKQLLERDADARAAAARTDEAIDEAIVAIKEAVDGLSAELADGVKEIVGTLHLPVKPAYFPDGKLRHAQRVDKPGA